MCVKGNRRQIRVLTQKTGNLGRKQDVGKDNAKTGQTFGGWSHGETVSEADLFLKNTKTQLLHELTEFLMILE
jgi:hypothetical protein